MKQFLLFLLFCTGVFMSLQAQDATPSIQRYLLENKDKWHLSAEEATNGWIISDQYTSQQITHVYVQQTIHGLKLHNAISAAALKNGEVLVLNSRFTAHASEMVNAMPGTAQLRPQDAVLRAAEAVGVAITDLKSVELQGTPQQEYRFTAGGEVQKPIKVFPVYQKMADRILLAWNIEIKAKNDWWSIRVDALTGVVLDKTNYTVYCNFHPDAYQRLPGANHAKMEMSASGQMAADLTAGAAYRVFPFPGESPNHTTHQLINTPADALASPYGWHDTNGAAGPEYTITRGNNVLAAEDRDDNDTPGYSPDGGSELLFDFPYDGNQEPLVWQDAAITNLFYANNIMHDIIYRYGFDEAAGNFQENNYSRGGDAGDAVQADAQDGSGTNNANFSTPPDGEQGRMQMYVWTASSGDSVRVLSPSGIAGKYNAPRAAFGLPVTSTITADLVLVEDGVLSTHDACDPILNGPELVGKIALIDRGNCVFAQKVKAAQEAGAIAVLICNNVDGDAYSMPGTDNTVTIPSAMISLADCGIIKTALANGPVSVSFEAGSGSADLDSDVDNGVIAHEYGHGISTRLTGGPSNSSCLNNAEQMGEGWSDWYALVTTLRATDDRFTPRPMGTYVFDEPVTGDGIRRQVYSTDMSVCTYTYDDLPATQGQVHNVGELWTAMLWDMTWDLIDQYGLDPDMYSGMGGNNIALQLVTDGMKLQACNPGFTDGRDAILLADQIRYNGANQCLIWAAFARRGLGFTASQGSSSDVSDGTAAFDVPPVCQIAVLAPTAGFTVDRTVSCLDLATFKFSDQSQNLAQYWLWDFGDGTTSTETNPVHQYAAAGTYTVAQKVTNNISADSVVFSDLIVVTQIAAPAVTEITVCAGQSADLTATLSSSENTAEWKDGTGTLVFTGTTFNTPPLLTTTSYSIQESENVPTQHIGPLDFGAGGNHNTSFIGQVLFTAQKSFSIKSVLVRAQGTTNRDISLFNAAGNVIQTVTVNIPDGQSRINLNMDVPGPGNYSLGAGPNVNLYRDNAEVTYPFDIAELVTITGSNAGSPGFYYYFYDWEIQETPCRSAPATVTVQVTPGPLANFNYSNNGLVVTFTGLPTGNPTSITWDFGDNTTSTELSPVHTYANADIYSVRLTVSDGNCTHVFTQVIDFLTGTSSLNNDLFDALISPNPASEQAKLTLTGVPGSRYVQVSLYSVDGRLMQTMQHDTQKGSVISLQMEGWASGVYWVKVRAGNGVLVRKLVVE